MVIFHSYVSLPEGNNSDYLWLAVIRLQFREAAAKTAYPLQQLDDVRRLGPTVFFFGGKLQKNWKKREVSRKLLWIVIYYILLYDDYYYYGIWIKLV